MNEVILTIDEINCILEDIILENSISYLGNNTKDILSVYSSDFCDIMLSIYPSATIMIHKTYKKCAVLINGVLYGSYGIENLDSYSIANSEDINYIQKGFPKLSFNVLTKLYESINEQKINLGKSYTLRKDINKLI